MLIAKNRKTQKSVLVKFCFYILFLGFVFSFAGCSSKTNSMDPVQNAVLDLTSPDKAEDIVRLDGDWKFVYGCFLSPDDPAWQTDIRQVRVPDVWKNYSTEQVRLDNQGICTMQILVKTNGFGQKLGLKLNVVESAYNLFINENLVLESGRTGTDRKSEQASYKPQVLYFTPEAKSFLLTIQISNYHDRLGGMWTSAIIGPEEKIALRNYLDIAIEMIVLGILLILSLYYFIVWLLDRNRVSSLFFSLGCLMLWLRTMTAGEIFFMIVFPGFGFELNYKLQFASQAAAAVFLFMCVRRIFPSVFQHLAERIVQIVMFVYIVFIFATPLIVYSKLLSWFHIFLIAAALYFFIALARAIHLKLTGSRILGAGAFLFVCSVVNDILYSNAIINTGYMVLWGLIVFSLSFIIVLEKLNKTGRRIKEIKLEFFDFESANISKREFEVLQLLVKGLSYFQIAEKLFIAHSTVTKHIHSIYQKLGVKNRVNLYEAVQERTKSQQD